VIDLASRHPIHLGDLRMSTLQEVLDRAQSNPILHALRAWGPKMLIELLRAGGLEDELPSAYIKESVCDACYKLMSNERVVAYLGRLAEDKAFQRKVAYARAYYLDEPEMIQALGLTEYART